MGVVGWVTPYRALRSSQRGTLAASTGAVEPRQDTCVERPRHATRRGSSCPAAFPREARATTCCWTDSTCFCLQVRGSCNALATFLCRPSRQLLAAGAASVRRGGGRWCATAPAERGSAVVLRGSLFCPASDAQYAACRSDGEVNSRFWPLLDRKGHERSSFRSF